MDNDVDKSAAADDSDASPVAEIVDWVARGIIEGRLGPGDDLNSVDLAKRFGVSRTRGARRLVASPAASGIGSQSQGRPGNLSTACDPLRTGFDCNCRAGDGRRH